jgi:hypothetical protein
MSLMKTIQETETFKKQADKIWTEDERLKFITYIAENPDVGDVIPNADGARKIRWTASNTGKRGGVRIIYFNLDADLLCLVAIYKKTEKENMKPKEIKEVR